MTAKYSALIFLFVSCVAISASFLSAEDVKEPVKQAEGKQEKEKPQGEKNTKNKKTSKAYAEVKFKRIDASGDGYWDWHMQDDYEYMSPRFWEIFGYTPEEKKHHHGLCRR